MHQIFTKDLTKLEIFLLKYMDRIYVKKNILNSETSSLHESSLF